MHEKHIQFNSRYHQLIHELRFVLYQMLYSNLALKETRVVKKSCGFKNACFFFSNTQQNKKKVEISQLWQHNPRQLQCTTPIYQKRSEIRPKKA